MKFQLSASILLFSYGASLCSAWGTLGHDTIAYVATNFVSSATKTYFQNILGDTSTDYLAKVATYADSYRYTTAGKFSAPFHFIDAQDNPPSSCGVDFDRDCGEKGCVVSAIKNYTSRVQTTALSASERAFAAKMIIHFVGDIHQPLHDENLDVGGNDISVTFDGKSTNLHAVWETSIPEKLIGGYSLSDAKTWAANLTTEIKTGSYKEEKEKWLDGIDIDDAQKTSMVWASDSNAFVCSEVMPDGVGTLEGEDLGGRYYEGVVGTVEEQVAKAGYRLAAWLNLIATGKTGL